MSSYRVIVRRHRVVALACDRDRLQLARPHSLTYAVQPIVVLVVPVVAPVAVVVGFVVC